MSIYARFSEQELAILRERAERAAIAEEKPNLEETLTVVHVTLGNEFYALSVERLRAVYENIAVISVPYTPPFVAGIANIRGRITPVLDLATVLNVPPSADVPKSLLMIVRDELSVVFQVNTVGDIATILVNSIEPMPSGGQILASEIYLQGIFANGITLLNIEAILNDPALIVDHASG